MVIADNRVLRRSAKDARVFNTEHLRTKAHSNLRAVSEAHMQRWISGAAGSPSTERKILFGLPYTCQALDTMRCP